MLPVLMSLSMYLFVGLLIDSACERLSAQCGTSLKMNCSSGWVLLHASVKTYFLLNTVVDIKVCTLSFWSTHGAAHSHFQMQILTFLLCAGPENQPK